MSTAILFLALVPLVAWALHRDIKRAIARRRFRKLAAPFKAAAAAFSGFGPAMASATRAAREFEESMRRVQITLTADTSKFQEALRKARKEAR